ncbi:MAG: isoprenylcysteine carboxylmethyltransferase family protein [Planctomycetes bacterium]|nr:isoprenylcysteine carboxylmethyltransferase family protein [Planctomycetota bacterium]
MMFKKLRTNVRRIYVICILVFGNELEPAYTFAGIACILLGTFLHLLASGYLTKETKVVSAGPYAYVRNPFYAANLFCDAGMSLITFNLYVVIVYFAVFYLLIIPFRIKGEEQTLTKLFGDKYERYTKNVHRFIPFLKINPKSERSGAFTIQSLIKNQEIPRSINTLNIILMLVLSLEIKKSGLTPLNYILITTILIIYGTSTLLRKYLKRYR